MQEVADGVVLKFIFETVIPFLGHVGTVIAGVVGWLYHGLLKRIEALEASLQNVREELPATYVTQQRLQADMREVKDTLRHMDTKLDRINEHLIERGSQ